MVPTALKPDQETSLLRSNFHSLVDRLFEESLSPWNFWNQFDQLANRFFGNVSKDRDEVCAWVPSVDLIETADSMVVEAEVPGMQKEQIRITYSEGVLAIEGDRAADGAKDGKSHLSERPTGKFHRAFRLPMDVDVSKMKAEYRLGVLTITVPKTEAAKPKIIQIK